MEYTVKLKRRLDGREFLRKVEAWNNVEAGFMFDTATFEVYVLGTDWKPTLQGKPL